MFTQTNPLLWTESYEYDHRTGQVLKHTDVNGHVTRYKYDGFGRSRLTEYPDGINLIEKISWYTGVDVDNARYYTEAQATGSPPVKTWYDRVGRELKTQSTDFAGNYVYTLVEYDSKGRKYKVYEPYATSTGLYTEFTYDNLGRNDETILPTNVKLITDYSDIASNEISTYKEYNSQQWDNVTKTMNAFGKPVSIEDEGGTITYTYTSAGQAKSITSNGSTINITYDVHGNRYTLDDPDATPGTQKITTEYNAFDELIEQTDGRGKTYTMTYDKLGRITTRSGTETTTWTYSTTAGHLGELSTVSCNNNTSQSFAYDNLGRLTSQTENILGESFTQYYTYDDLGRLQSQSWNTGFGIKHRYNSHGYLSKVQTAGDETIWEAETYNVRGQITSYLSGSGYRTQKSWDTYGFPTWIITQTTGSTPDDRQREGYDFDEKRGNLMERSLWESQAHFEDFRYDDLHRLVADSLSTTDFRNTDYSTNGNITNRSDIGDFTYDGMNGGPHAVTDLSNTTGSLLPADNQLIDYTDFNKASYITQGDYSYFITYGHDRLRRKTVLDYEPTNPTEYTTLTKYYAFGDYERETTQTGTRHLHYISGGDGLAAIFIKHENGADSLYYVMKDHLGSLVGLINSESGKVYRQSFDAWGRNRNPEDWTYTDIPDDFPFARGYTGHEHLKWFGLINMNGRMYDASLCRFLSPDPYVQMPDYTQNFNRYSYALNNPLIYSDPSGEFWHLVIGAAIGGTLNVIFNAGNIDNIGDGFKYFGIGAAAGALAAGVGAGVGAALAGNAAAGGGFAAGFLGTASISSTGFLAGALSGGAAGVTNGLLIGTGNGMMNGQNFTDAFMEGGLDQAWKQGLGGAAFGGLMGTVDAISQGEDWLTGSPYKRLAYTNGKTTMTPDAAATKNITDVKIENSVTLDPKNEPYSIEIPAPDGWEVTTGKSSFSFSDEDIIDHLIYTDNNSVIVEFPMGTPNGGGYAIGVQQPKRLNGVWHYSNKRDFSTLFWYLKFLKK